MANLAIKGHESRGKEIIGFLRMLGANNTYQLSGDEDYAYIEEVVYTISSDTIDILPPLK